MKHTYYYFVLLLMFSFYTVQSQTVTVAQNGSGNFTTIKAAIAAAPTTATLANPYVIMVKNGYYFEKDTIPSNKPFIQLIGESAANTIIAFNAAAGLPTPTGGTYGTAGSATLTVNASDFTAMNLTVANTFNYDSAVTAGFAGSQAVAFEINADRAAFKNCVFTGFQDTLYTKGTGNPRHYFKNCYIDGNVDFIFGSSIDVFDSCIIFPKARTGGGTSYITAANTTIGQNYGYVFRDCKIEAHSGTTLYYLGRPWNNATAGITANNKVAYLNSTMSYIVNPPGWTIWDAGTDTTVISYAEYKSKRFDGTLVDVSKRVSWSKQLADTTGYNLFNIFSGWDPCTSRADFCSYQPTEIVVANFKGAKGATVSNFTWNVCFPMAGIVYELYKSIDNKASFQSISSTTAVTDTSVNFSAIDAFPPSGNIYYYYVKASLPGTLLSNLTDTISISSAPTVTTLGSLGSFIQSINPAAPSTTQSYVVKASNLVADVTITPAVNFEISADGGSTWYNNTTPLVITRTADSIPTKTILVRLYASIVGSWSGNIANSTTGTGAINVNVPVSGTTINTALLNLIVLQQWPLMTSNSDSVGVRNQYLGASTSRLNNVYASLGTVATVPAYSATYGQALGASTTVDGGWGTANGGPGGNLNRNFYEEFSVTPFIPIGNITNVILRIDSLILNADFYNTNSNTKMAIVFSRDGFVSDSFDLPGAAFATPVVLNKNNTGTTDNYRLALNGANGIITNGTTGIKFRIYFSCGSSSAGRFALLQNVIIKGVISVVNPVELTSFKGTKTNKAVLLNWNTVNEVNADYFNIERSINDIDFTNLGSITAYSTPGTHSYQFTDNMLPVCNKVYYRLRLVDVNGKFTYSNVIQEIISTSEISLQAYPNPVIASLKLEHGPASSGSEFKILNTMGKIVLNYKPIPGSTSSIISTEALMSGNYFIVYINGMETYSLSFIKK